MVDKELAQELLANAEPDHVKKRWSQIRHLGGSMAVELEIGELLHSLVRAVKPTTVIETGTHMGFSAIMLGDALRANGFGHLYTIDSRDYQVPALLQRCGLQEWATFIQSKSVIALGELRKALASVDLLWLDADHALDSVLEELEAALPLLKSGSYIAFHDTLLIPSENEAVVRIRQKHPQWEYLRFVSSRGFDLMRIP